MEVSHLINALRNPNDPHAFAYAAPNIKTMLLNRIRHVMAGVTDSFLIANHELTTTSPKPGGLAANFLNSNVAINPDRLFFDLTSRMDIADGRSGYALRIRGYSATELPTLYVCVDDNHKVYAGIFDANSLVAEGITPEEELIENLELGEIEVGQIERVILSWMRNYISEKHLEKMTENSFSIDLQNARGVRHTLAERNPLYFDQQRILLQGDALAKEFAQLLGDKADQFYNILKSTLLTSLEQHPAYHNSLDPKL